MEFRILGPLEVVDGDAPVEIAGAKRKAVLAVLVLRANEVVRSEWLIDELWGEQVPRNAAAALHNHVSRLRKEIGPEALARREWGYVLRVSPESIDLRRFEDLLAVAESQPARERAETLREALGLWRGPPLADLALEPALQRDIARLEELRLSTLERRVDADLEMGRTSELVGELEVLIAENALREHLRWQLIIALYRAGRQAEALEVYRETRRVLAEELGLDPSPALRELEKAILRQDPALVVPPPPQPTTPPPAAPVSGGRHRMFASVLGLAVLGAAGAIAATTLSHGGRAPVAAATQTVRTVVETVHRSVTAAPVTTRYPLKHVAVKRQKTATHHAVARTVTQARATVVKTTTAAHVRHVIRHAKKQTTTTTTTTVTTKPQPVRIADDFTSSTLDAARWLTWSWGSGVTAEQGGGRLAFGISASPQFDSQYGVVGPNYSLACRFLGNFDARVEYELVDWPAGNDASVEFTAATPEWTWIVSRSGGSYSSWPTGVSVASNDTSGTMRFARSNGLLRMFFLRGARWRQIGETNLRGEVRLQLGLKASAANWQQSEVSAAFENFAVTAPAADCPPGDDPRG